MIREEVIATLEDIIETYRNDEEYKDWVKACSYAINLIIDMEIEAFKADTVEVVRCKDCKHYKPFDKSKKFDCPQGLYAVFENDYCSHGERSEE